VTNVLMGYRWLEQDEHLRYLSPCGTVAFDDSLDHWRNGVCRLLGISDEDGRNWVERVTHTSLELCHAALRELSDDDVVSVLRRAWTAADGGTDPTGATMIDLTGARAVLGARPDAIFGSRIGGDPGLAVVGSQESQLAWLVDVRTLDLPVAQTSYDEAYFEGERPGVGYGGYLQQEAWRMQKARRFLKRVEAAAGLTGVDLPGHPALLDVGAGYGFFRQAAEERGWRHEGVEVSTHAAEIGKELFGFSSAIGVLEEFADQTDTRFDVLTMWDVLEHVPDPSATLRAAYSLLRRGGALFVRTPNLAALERDVFGSQYHSFKAEHLYYFGPSSLIDALHAAGFSVGLLVTDAHLLSGFLGRRLERFAMLLRGSDLFVVALKSADPR
jgi:2-polyprenyl-3-methyl-5-hydroxy-6-metoxy-1,4-benzoquinol methylase